MKYDYENVLEYAVEQATEKGFSEGEAEGRAEGEAKGRKEGEAKGRKEGEAKGRAEGVASVISKLLKSGFSADVIASATGLSITEIQKYCGGSRSDEYMAVYQVVTYAGGDCGSQDLNTLIGKWQQPGAGCCQYCFGHGEEVSMTLMRRRSLARVVGGGDENPVKTLFRDFHLTGSGRESR